MALLEFSKTYKPFIYPWAVELTKKHEEIHWIEDEAELSEDCLLYTSPSPRDGIGSRMPSSA